MNSTLVSVIAFACVLGGAMLGLYLHRVLPPHYLKEESKNAVQLGMGLIGTMTAILLGVLIGSAKSFFDSQINELTEVSAKITLLDRALALYGPEAQDVRAELRRAVQNLLDITWPAEHSPAPAVSSTPGSYAGLYEKIAMLQPQTDLQRSLQSQATNVVVQLATTRFLISEQQSNSVPIVLLVVVIFWLTLTFCSFGLLAPRTGVVIVTFLFCALSVASALFLLLEMYSPYTGVVHVSSAPIRMALGQLGP